MEKEQMLWMKAFHVIAMVCWFAGLFYLPRLFVYHAMAQQEGDTRGVERFKVMERKLYRGIMTPAMLLTVALGLGMLIPLWGTYYGTAAWMHIKLALVVVLLAYHHVCGRMVRGFASDSNQRGHVFYRIFNELPVLILVAVVILVILKQPV
jgi:putative membrane protein